MTEQPASTSASPRPVSENDLARVAHGAHALPHDYLGPHRHDGAVTVRTVKPFAETVYAVTPDGTRTQLEHELEGVWVGVLPVEEVPEYRLEVTYPGHEAVTMDEPYRFLPTVRELDRHLIAEGRHEELWNVLGAHVQRYPGRMGEVVGTSFSVWAPHAQAVRVVGDFNHWVGRGHAMRSLGGSGVWELFVPDAGAGTLYKYEILGRDGRWRQKADPLAQGTQVPPATASVVVESSYQWGDDEWLAERAARDPHNGPMSIYEVHLGSWRQGLDYRTLADQLVGHVKHCGFTHVELMPVMEHPYGGSWGYQVTSYYAPTARFGHPDDFRYFVDRLHQAGIGIIVDWVPGHFPRDAWALARFDGEPLYEYPDPRKGAHPDWGTLVFDYGRPEVRNFLVANALFWLEEFHIDGIRVDAVASMLYLDYSREEGQWIPNKYGGREHLEAIEFLQEFNGTAYKRVPGIVTIAEESTAWPGVTRPTYLGGLGFGLKWNMGWMHDSLGYMAEDPVYRQYHHHRMTFSLMYAFSEQFVLPISHDEVVYGKGSLLGKMPGDRWQRLANLRAFLAYMWAHPGKQLLFMGSEFAQEREWAESGSLDWELLDDPMHLGVQDLVVDLNRRYLDTPALHEIDFKQAGFDWIDVNDNQHNVFSFIRWDKAGNPLVCIVNFSGEPHEGYRVGLPEAGPWNEVLNTDAVQYGGSGVGNLGRVEAEEIEHHGRPASVRLRVPPLGAVWLEPAHERKVYVPPVEEEAPVEEKAVEKPAAEKPVAEKPPADETTVEEPASTQTAAPEAARTPQPVGETAATPQARVEPGAGTGTAALGMTATPASPAESAEDSTTAKKTAARKTTTDAAKNATAKKATAKTPTARTTKKATEKKAAENNATENKATAAKDTAAKDTAKKTSTRKAPAKKAVPGSGERQASEQQAPERSASEQQTPGQTAQPPSTGAQPQQPPEASA